MSLELVKEAVKLNQPIGEESTQTVVENDIIVPDVKPDIAHIVLLDGDAYVNSVEAASDKLLINGTIRYVILYISDDPGQSLKSINTAAGFQYTMEIPDTRQGMQCRVKCNIEHLEHEIINSRKVNVKAVLSLDGTVTNRLDQQIVQDFDGVEDIQVLRRPVGVSSYIGGAVSGYQVNETLEVMPGKPAVLELLRNDVKIIGKEFNVTEDKVIAKGELNISTLYISDDEMRSIQFMEHEIPFSHIIEISGADETSYCSVDFEIGDAIFEPAEDTDGELRMLKADVMLNISAECYGRKEIELIEDAYSPRSGISLEKEQLNMEELLSETKSQVTLKDTVEIDVASPDISEVFNVLVKLSLSGSEVTDDRIFMEGVAACNILYLADNEEQPVYCTYREIPFKQVLDVKGAKEGMKPNIEMNLEHLSYSMLSSKEVELRFVVGLETRVVNQVVIPAVSKAAEQPIDEKRLTERPGIIIYFAQDGDTLWRIAKKYYTTVDEIKRNNEEIDTGVLAAGEQILIPKRI